MSLMADQVDYLRCKGARAAMLSSRCATSLTFRCRRYANIYVKLRNNRQIIELIARMRMYAVSTRLYPPPSREPEHEATVKYAYTTLTIDIAHSLSPSAPTTFNNFLRLFSICKCDTLPLSPCTQLSTFSLYNAR